MKSQLRFLSSSDFVQFRFFVFYPSSTSKHQQKHTKTKTTLETTRPHIHTSTRPTRPTRPTTGYIEIYCRLDKDLGSARQDQNNRDQNKVPPPGHQFKREETSNLNEGERFNNPKTKCYPPTSSSSSPGWLTR